MQENANQGRHGELGLLLPRNIDGDNQDNLNNLKSVNNQRNLNDKGNLNDQVALPVVPVILASLIRDIVVLLIVNLASSIRKPLPRVDFI